MKTWMATVKAPGNEFRITLIKNRPSILDLFGCNDKKKAGIPMANVSMITIWADEKG